MNLQIKADENAGKKNDNSAFCSVRHIDPLVKHTVHRTANSEAGLINQSVCYIKTFLCVTINRTDFP